MTADQKVLIVVGIMLAVALMPSALRYVYWWVFLPFWELLREKGGPPIEKGRSRWED